MFMVQEIEIDKIEIGAHAATWAKTPNSNIHRYTHSYNQRINARSGRCSPNSDTNYV